MSLPRSRTGSPSSSSQSACFLSTNCQETPWARCKRTCCARLMREPTRAARREGNIPAFRFGMGQATMVLFRTMQPYSAAHWLCEKDSPVNRAAKIKEESMRKFLIHGAAVAALVAGFSGSAAAQVTLRASHQFPGGKGDVRDEMVQIIAREAKAANNGVEIQVYPGASLFKPNEQWNALVNGQLDISSFPLDYASGKVRAFGATLMPGLVRSHDRAQRVNNSAFMKEIKAQIDKAGVMVLADAWLAGAIASKKA